MKRTIVKKVNIDNKSDSSDVSMNCSCQILNDTSLSNVGDSQCDCSECLEANLDAFNQFKNEQIKTHDTTREVKTKKQANMSKPHSNAKQQKQQSSNLHRYRSSDRFAPDRKTSKKWGVKMQKQERDSEYYGNLEQENQYSNGQINDFLLITRYRTRKYLEERKKLEQEQKQKKQELKQKIKKNLELLKYTSMYQNQRKEGEQELAHPYKWNHSKYKCECNGKKHSHQKHKCCNTIKVKQTLDTNLHKLKENFMQNRDLILQERKKKRQQKIKHQQGVSCPDQCPDHHNRTDQNKRENIKKFINKNVKKYYKDLDKKKKQKEEKEKIKQGKLRAIDIKSKQILGRSKKVDDDISRTSFRLSIDQYDTFSELRQQNQRRRKMKENDREIKRAMKEGGGELEKKIYEQLEEEEEAQDPSEIKIKTKAQAPQYRSHDKIYQRIAYDAQIKPPSNYKTKPQVQKKSKNEIGREENKQEKKKNLSKGKQEEQKKRIQNEIEKKKKQIMQQFNKRNSNKPSNHELRKQYQEKVDKNKQTKKMKPERDEPSKDPFRTNYPTKAGKNPNQIQVHGDPLLQQYTYHKEKEKVKLKGIRGENMDVFNENIHSLTSKPSLKP